MHTNGHQAMTMAWQHSAHVQLEWHGTCQRRMAQLLHLFASALTSVGEISLGSYMGQEQTEVACNNMCKQLRSVQADDKLKALVLRVDSPGG